MDDEKTFKLYLSMSDSQLIDLRRALMMDYQNARARDDGVSMAFCEQRLKLVEKALEDHGKG